MEQFDVVRLKPEFENKCEYTIAEVKYKDGERVATLFPKGGGVAVSAAVDSLVKVGVCYQCGIKVAQSEIEDGDSNAGECNTCHTYYDIA